MAFCLLLPLEGLSCASCAGRVEGAVRSVPGVVWASVNLASAQVNLAMVEASSAADTVRAACQAVTRVGYGVLSKDIALSLEGMSCASCVRRIEQALLAIPGVIDVAVNLATEQANVRIAADTTTVSTLIAAAAAVGYRAQTAEPEDAAEGTELRRDREIQHLRRLSLLAILLTAPVFVLEMGTHMVPGFHHLLHATLGRQTSWVVQFLLTSAVLFGPGWRFFRLGLPALAAGYPDMNSLVALGTGAAWSYSLVATFAPGLLPEGTANVYFEAAAVIVTLILLGRYLEVRARGRTGEAIRRLMELQAKTARVYRDGEIVEIPLEQVAVDDLVQVRPGERIAVDGQVVEGSSFVDESMITGEPMPVAKKTGAQVVGSTINKNGSLTFRATRVGADTVLAHIIQMVRNAQGAKLPIQAFVDRVTARFVPAVLGIAVLTFLVWLSFGPEPALTYALVNAVAVLIIACPCAMGLATPTSIMVGTGRAAEMGVLFRKGEALQRLRDAQVVALDKTGTLTKGRPELTDIAVLEGFDQAQVLSLVATAENPSEHPVAEAIVLAARKRGLPLAATESFEALPGWGIRATIGGVRVLVGADRLLVREGIDLAGFAEEAGRLADEGKTPLYAAIDGRLAAIIAVSDPIKETTPQALRALHRLGLEIAMITGDNQRTARAIARLLEIDTVVAEVLPEGKVEALQGLRRGGKKVAFVGDGINDAPALAAADVGLAIGTGTDVAIESADVVLMSGDLSGVANGVAISRATLRNIQQNLFWAFAYNALLLPVAAGVLYPAFGLLLSPIFAGGAMAFSSISVVGNALRLKNFSPPLNPQQGSVATDAHTPKTPNSGRNPS